MTLSTQGQVRELEPWAARLDWSTARTANGALSARADARLQSVQDVQDVQDVPGAQGVAECVQGQQRLAASRKRSSAAS